MTKINNHLASDELLEVVDRSGKVLSIVKRSELHGNPSLLHRVVHVLLFNKKGELLLQKRSTNKDVAPGKWDTSVGGHVNPGENIHIAAKRELKEELGITRCRIEFLHEYIFSNHIESELVSTFTCVYNGNLIFNKDEIDGIKFWGLDEISKNLGNGLFSRHFEVEFKNYIASN